MIVGTHDVPCALCGSDDRRPLHDVTLWAEPIRIVRCVACGHVFRSPRPDDDALDAYYDEEYYTGSGDEGAYVYDDERADQKIARRRAAARLQTMERVLGRTGKLLEVGCSFGLFLAEARDRGWDPVGVDVSPYAAGWAKRELDIDVRVGRLADLTALAEASFDAAYLSETIEHLTDPVGDLRFLASRLAPGGILVVGTGNVASVAARVRGARWGYFMPGHLQLFSIASIERTFRAVGLTPLRTFVPDDRGFGAAVSLARAEGQGALRAVATRAVQTLRIGRLAVGAGMVAYARREP